MTFRKDNVEKAVIEALDKISQKPLPNDRCWTTSIQKKMTTLGKKKEYGVHASRARQAENEWLYDVTWYDYSKNGLLISIPLIAEIEWSVSNDAIFYDFEKLLQSTADHKIIIFQKGPKVWEDVMDKLEKSVKRFKQKFEKDRYLFACYVGDNKTEEYRFEYRLVVR